MPQEVAPRVKRLGFFSEEDLLVLSAWKTRGEPCRDALAMIRLWEVHASCRSLTSFTKFLWSACARRLRPTLPSGAAAARIPTDIIHARLRAFEQIGREYPKVLTASAGHLNQAVSMSLSRHVEERIGLDDDKLRSSVDPQQCAERDAALRIHG
jgi:hypothetical protein